MKKTNSLPPDFVYLADVVPDIIEDIRYFTTENFVGRPIKGYHAPRCILTERAAIALKTVQQQLKSNSLGLKVFDGYRPQQAVNDFIVWSEDPNDQKMKAEYYPHINKKDMFNLHYLAKKSGHSRGSTIDLTIVKLNLDGLPIAELPMGTSFDFMDELSHTFSPHIADEAKRNRLHLQQLMAAAGFKSIPTEWWHFTLEYEPFPNTYFDFPVE